MSFPGLSRPSELPVTSAMAPAIVLRFAVLILGVALTLVDYGTSGWLAVGILFSFLAAWEARSMLGWMLILFYVLGQISHRDTLDWQLLVLIAGIHLLHVLCVFQIGIPWRGWMALNALAQPLLRFVAIQLPCQLFAVAVLLLLEPNSAGHGPVRFAAVGVLGVIALLGLALLLLRPRAGRP